jgi:hypothetical protein
VIASAKEASGSDAERRSADDSSDWIRQGGKIDGNTGIVIRGNG